MGFNFRKSVKMGPVRVNLSKSGVGCSVGGKGMRVTKKAGGGTRTTVGIPGTGISYSSDSKKKSSRKKTASPKTSVSTNGSTSTSSGPGCLGVIGFVFVFSIIVGVLKAYWKIILAFAMLIAAVYVACKVYQKKHPKEIALPAGPSIEPKIDTPDVVSIPEEVKQTVTPQKSEFQIRLEEMQQFEDELTAIPMAEIGLSDPAPRQLLKNLPEYSFSNITKKTRLDSIFPLVFLDVETTGFAPSKCEILEVSAIKFESGMTPVAAFTTLCKPNKPIPEEASAVNHITDDMVSDAPAFSQIAPALTDFLAGCHVAGHNLDFDLRFIFAHGAKIPEKVRFYDTLDLAQLTIPKSAVDNYKLDRLCFYYGVWRNNSHRSLSDCYATSKIFTHLVSDKTGRQLDANAEIESEKDAE